MIQPRSRIYLETLEEIAGSDDLLEAFANETERYYQVPAPKDFSQTVLKKSGRLDVQAAAKASQASRRLQLFSYSLRVGTAVAGALFLLFSIPTLTPDRNPAGGLETRIVRQTNRISSSLSEFSYQLFDWR